MRDDGDTLSQLKKLKMTFDWLRDQYVLTRHPLHYLRFEEALREYKAFIETHKLSGRTVSESLYMDLDLDTDTDTDLPILPPLKQAGISEMYQRPCPTHPKNLKSQKKMMDFMERQDSFKGIKDIVPHLSLKTAQVRRHLYSLTEQGLLKMRAINGVQCWKKASDE